METIIPTLTFMVGVCFGLLVYHLIFSRGWNARDTLRQDEPRVPLEKPQPLAKPKSIGVRAKKLPDEEEG